MSPICGESSGQEKPTTLKIKNIPKEIRQILGSSSCTSPKERVHDEFAGLLFSRQGNLGYALVNFTTYAGAEKIKRVFSNYKWKGRRDGNFEVISSDAVIEIEWTVVQGKEALVGMLESEIFLCDDEEFLPVVLEPPRDGSLWIPAAPVNIGRICRQSDGVPHQPEPAVLLSLEMEQKLDLEAPEQAPQPQSPPLVQSELPPARRPGFGNVGRRIMVKANHFLVEVEDRDLHHYDVTISPEVASKKVCREIIDQLMKDSDLSKEKLAYDGRRSCYAASSLPFKSKDFAVELVDADSQSRRVRKFKVSIKHSSKPDLYQLKQFIQGRQLDLPQETIQLFNVVLKQYQYKSGLVVGRSCFHRGMGNGRDLGNGLDYVPGFYQSLHPTQMGLSLNIDMSGTAFFRPILVVDYVAKHINKDLTSGLSDQDRTEVKRALKGVRVETHHLGQVRRHKISGISTQSTQQLMFSLDGKGTQISVAHYFSQKYNIVLQFPNLPAVEAGSDTKPIYLPMELCSIVDHQRYSRKLNVGQVTSFLRETCIQPSDREKSIMQVVKDNHDVNDELHAYKKFGISVSRKLTSIEARVLPPPTLEYHETDTDSLVTPRVGQWNMINKKMINGGKIKFWACINFSRVSDADVGQFCDDLIGLCSRKGMKCNPQPIVPVRSAHGPIEKALFDLKAETSSELRKLDATGEQLQLLIVILPEMTDSYGTIKRVCETELGIVSQCFQSKNIVKSCKQYMQYMENVSLKINAKVGGRNWELEDLKLELTKEFPYFTECPTIIFGADVTHPQAGDDSSPSIAAVVASMNFPEVTTKYRGLVSAQAHGEEIIQDLYIEKVDPKRGLMRRGMIRELLTSFYRETGYKPRRIIFYRDGVSEGQFSQVLLHEMKAIREACASIDDYIPTVTFIVVQKRHHTRLFPADHNTDRSGNVLPGTVVDTEICHPTGFDFYLCSHAGIKGTSRPTHYHVLYDENEFSADGLQMLTNRLCYTYARCTRSVSVVPPVYYAHLAARRARYYVQGTDSGSASDAGSCATREVQPLPTIKDNVKNVMFYI